MVLLAVASVETVTVVPVAVAILAASVVLVQVPEHPPMYAEVSDTPVSVITKVTVATRLPVADEAISASSATGRRAATVTFGSIIRGARSRTCTDSYTVVLLVISFEGPSIV